MSRKRKYIEERIYLGHARNVCSAVVAKIIKIFCTSRSPFNAMFFFYLFVDFICIRYTCLLGRVYVGYLQDHNYFRAG